MRLFQSFDMRHMFDTRRILKAITTTHAEEMKAMSKLDDAVAKLGKAVDDVAVRVQTLIEQSEPQAVIDALDADSAKLDAILPVEPPPVV